MLQSIQIQYSPSEEDHVCVSSTLSYIYEFMICAYDICFFFGIGILSHVLFTILMSIHYTYAQSPCNRCHPSRVQSWN